MALLIRLRLAELWRFRGRRFSNNVNMHNMAPDRGGSVGYELARRHGQCAVTMEVRLSNKKMCSPCSLLVACPPFLAQRARCRHHRGKRVHLGAALILFIVAAVSPSYVSRSPQGHYFVVAFEPLLTHIFAHTLLRQITSHAASVAKFSRSNARKKALLQRVCRLRASATPKSIFEIVHNHPIEYFND